MIHTLHFVYLIVLLNLAVFGAHRFILVLLHRKYRSKHVRPLSRFQSLPKVTVQLPIYNEKFVVERLLEAVIGIQYPKDKLEIQVLDDSDDETMGILKDIVERIKIQGFTINYYHRENRSGYKAGALHEGLLCAKGDYIALFDADFVPPPDFLMKTIHFFTDSRVGLVQTKWGHLNQNSSLLTQAQSILLDGHFIVEHTARYQSGLFFNFNGTAGMWRRRSILDAGGWQSETLTEDLDLSYRAQVKGWKFVYLDDYTVPAELPLDISAFKTQQHRWSKGTLQTAKKLLPQIWKSTISLKRKIEASFHLLDPIMYCVAMLLFILMGPLILIEGHALWWKSVLIDIPIFLLVFGSMCTFYTYTITQAGEDRWNRFKYLPIAVLLGIGMTLSSSRAVIEGLLGHQSPFQRTPKYGVRDRCQSNLQNKKSYRSLGSNMDKFELFFGFYFILLAIICGIDHQFHRLPFMLLFSASFLFVWGSNYRSQYIPEEEISASPVIEELHSLT